VLLAGGDVALQPRFIEGFPRRDKRPDVVVPAHGSPQRVPVLCGIEALDRAVPSLQRDIARHRRGCGIDRDARRNHAAHRRALRSSAKNLLSSALLMTPAKLSNLPSVAIAFADLMNASIATRASVPPTLIRRTPMAARSLTVKPNAPLLRKLIA